MQIAYEIRVEREFLDSIVASVPYSFKRSRVGIVPYVPRAVRIKESVCRTDIGSEFGKEGEESVSDTVLIVVERVGVSEDRNCEGCEYSPITGIWDPPVIPFFLAPSSSICPIE